MTRSARWDGDGAAGAARSVADPGDMLVSNRLTEIRRQ